MPENLQTVRRVNLLIHPGCMLGSTSESDLPTIKAYIEVYQRIVQTAIDMGEDELLIALPYRPPVQSNEAASQLVTDLIFHGVNFTEALDPFFLFDRLNDILKGHRFILAQKSIETDALFAEAEEAWTRRGFVLAPDARVVAFGEYMTQCVRGYAKDFALKYALGTAEVITAMTELPIEAASAGREEEALRDQLEYFSVEDPELLTILKADLVHVRYVPEWINEAIRTF